MPLYHGNAGRSTVSILCGIGLLFSPALYADPGTDCRRFSAEGSAILTGPPVPGEPIGIGSAIYHFQDGDRLAEVSSILLEPARSGDDGSQHMLVQVHHSFANGSTLTWVNRTVLSPTEIPGEFRLNEVNTVSAATGEFAGRDGRSVGHGRTSFNTFMTEVSARGWLCLSR